MNTRRPTVDVIDTGLAGGVHNAAMDRGGLELRAQGRGRDVLRFFRSHPAASIGRHQALDRELRLDYCHRHGIEIVRRPTSGGALYLDSGQLGFSLVIRQPATWRGLAFPRMLDRTCTAVAAALRQLGIAATSKAPNDVEAGGRKIASVFATRCGDAWLLQGSVLLDADIATMLKVLRVPTEKLSPGGMAAARERLTSIHALCADRPSLTDIQAALVNGIAVEFGLEPSSYGVTTFPVPPSPGQLAAERLLADRKSVV